MAGYATYTGKKASGQILKLRYDEIKPDGEIKGEAYNPKDIQLLADEIRENGIMQPFFVRAIEDGYELAAESERFYAAGLAEYREVPCVIIEKGSSRIAEMINRSNLTFFEEAEAIERLISYYGITQEDAAAQLGKAQSTIANKLRLLRLTEEEREMIMDNHLTERHARALLRISAPDERLMILNRVIEDGLNVEKTECMVEGIIGRNRRREPYRKRNRTMQNVKSFVNALNKAIESIQNAGVAVDAQRIQNDGGVEYRIKIPYDRNKNISSAEKRSYYN